MDSERIWALEKNESKGLEFTAAWCGCRLRRVCTVLFYSVQVMEIKSSGAALRWQHISLP